MSKFSFLHDLYNYRSTQSCIILAVLIRKRERENERKYWRILPYHHRHQFKKNERFIYCMLNKPIDIEEDARKRRKKNETTVMVQLYVTLNINHCNVCLQGNQTNNCDQLHEGYWWFFVFDVYVLRTYVRKW